MMTDQQARSHRAADPPSLLAQASVIRLGASPMARSLPRSARTGTAALLAAATLVALSACGSSSSSTAAPSSKSPVTISFWSWTGNAQQVVAEFNATHTDVHVNFTKITSGSQGGYTKVLDAAKAGNAPDVFNCEYQALPEFASQGDLKDLSSYFNSSLRSDFSPAAMSLVTLGGKQWSLPFDVEPVVLVYRKDLFAKFHLAVPTTWAQFQTEAQQLKAQDPKSVLVNYSPDDSAAEQALAWQNGAQWFTDDNGSWKTTLTDAPTEQVAGYWQNLISKGLASDKLVADPSLAPAIADGTVLTQILPASSVSTLVVNDPKSTGEWAAAPLPSWDGQPATGMDGGSSLAITTDNKNTAAAEEFAQWYATSADALKTKLGTDGPSLYPADAANAPTATTAFKANYSAYFGGQDLYSLFGTAAQSIKPGWTWGPLMVDTNKVLAANNQKVLTGGTLADSLSATQSQTLSDLKSDGYTVAQ